MSTWKQRYTALAIIVLNTCLLFAAVNLVFWGALRFFRRSKPFDPVTTFGLATVLKYYPGWKPEDVVALNREMGKLDETVYEYEPFTQFKHRPLRGRYLNIDPDRLSNRQESRPLTAYYSLMFMKPDIHEKVFAEVFRVLQPGGTCLVWDSVVPAATPGSEKESYTAWLRTHLPNETIVYGYSMVKFERPQDVPYYSSLATHTGFQVAEIKEQGSGKSFLMRLRKP